MKKLIISLGLFTSLLSTAVLAGNTEIMQGLKQLGLPTDKIKISDTPIANLKMVQGNEQPPFYITNDGKYITQGPIYAIKQSGISNIRNASHVALVNSVINDAIVYKAKNEQYVVTVFTDITCGYCKKLHEQIAEYNDLGITIRYLAFPRAGVKSPAGQQMQSIWSTKNRKAAFDKGYKTGEVATANSVVPYVAQQHNVGMQLGITGTPTIVLADGEVISGYLPPKELKASLDQYFAKNKK